MSLREEIERRRAGLPPSCVSTSKSPQTLSVYLANGERWVMPWARFVQAKLGESELTLVFAEREVVVQGSDLGKMMDSVAGLEVESVREIPGGYLALAEGRGPFITRLDARARIGS